MKWWQIRKRNDDLERELRSDLELEEEEQREKRPFGARRPAMRRCAPSAIPLLFANRLATLGPGIGRRFSRAICVMDYARSGGRRDSPSSRL